jgi:hypothetical protein
VRKRYTVESDNGGESDDGVCHIKTDNLEEAKIRAQNVMAEDKWKFVYIYDWGMVPGFSKKTDTLYYVMHGKRVENPCWTSGTVSAASID